jgi:catechol 2,3-dioxygenase-like lactoylglutathione lyase family enzyme
MIAHVGILVSDIEKSKKFYTEALKPIGYRLLLEFPASITGSTNVAGFGEPAPFNVPGSTFKVQRFKSPTLD